MHEGSDFSTIHYQYSIDTATNIFVTIRTRAQQQYIRKKFEKVKKSYGLLSISILAVRSLTQAAASRNFHSAEFQGGFYILLAVQQKTAESKATPHLHEQ